MHWRTPVTSTAGFTACRTPFVRLEGHTKGVHSCNWSALHRVFVSGGADKTVCIFNPFSGKKQATLEGHAATISDVLVNDADHQIISLSLVRDCALRALSGVFHITPAVCSGSSGVCGPSLPDCECSVRVRPAHLQVLIGLSLSRQDTCIGVQGAS